LPKAEQELETLVAFAPEDARASYVLGFLWLQEGKPEQAKEIFRKILAHNPNSADAHFGLASAAAAEAKYQDAIDEYKQAARLNPDLEGVNFNLGRAQTQLKLYDDAIASFEKEIEQVGDDYDTEIALANAYEAKGMKKEAAEARQKAAQVTGQK
jgi:tetratricopeptide (TPR) repeat protein